MKRSLICFIIVCMLLSVLSGTAVFAAEPTSGSCGDNVTWKYSSSTGTLTVSGSGEMYTYAEKWGWAAFSDSITSVSISNGVTSIGAYAFAGLTRLKTVSLPGTLDYIYEGAFEGCESLTSVTLPEGLLELYEFAFYGCTGLTGITLPKSLEYLGLRSFIGCTGLAKFTVSTSHSWLSTDASGVLFNKDKTALYMAPGGLTGDYTIPASATVVYPYAFFGCNGLEKIELSHASMIGEYAFAFCSNLKQFRTTQPSMSHMTLGEGAFLQCTDLSELYFMGSRSTFGENALEGVTATIRYPENPPMKWDDTPKENYGGNITWEPFCYNCEIHACEPYLGNVDTTLSCDTCGASIDIYVSQTAGQIAYDRNYSGILQDVTVSVKDQYTGQEIALQLPQAIASVSKPASGQVIHVKVPKGTTLTLTIPVSNITVNTGVYKVNGINYTYLNEAETTDAGVTVTVTESCDLVIAEHENPFTDVPADRFEEAILWAYHNGITTGTGDGTTFSPEATCTRKQIVTFLWRAAGEPEPKSMDNPFVDVPSDRFEKAILWAYYEGITTGTGDGTTFSPENTCTRKQIVTFLWRFHNEPAPDSMEIPFTDVKNDRFAPAILWAAEQGITTGTGDGTTFSPENPCTRKQIVTFLYRDLA